MARHYPEQLSRNDPETAALAKELYRLLPDTAKNEIDGLAKSRLGLEGYALLLVLYLISAARSGGILAAILTPFYIGALFFFAVGIILVVRRAMLVGGAVVPIFQQMVPDRAQEIWDVYGQRGLGDVYAPWVIRQRGRFGNAGAALFKGFTPWDRRR